MATAIEKAVGAPVTLRLTQLQADDPEHATLAIKEAGAPPAPLPIVPDMEATLRAEIPFPLAALQVDAGRKEAVAVPRPRSAVGLSAWRELESELARRHAGWHILVVPPVAGLPAISFAKGRSNLDSAGEERLTSLVWALQRWGAEEVVLTGHASSAGHGPLSLAQQRVETVSLWLGTRGVQVRGQAVYPVPMQKAREREVGEMNYRSVEISLAATADASIAGSQR
jgi:outer membrane protein OmpA-like peptidoglycan-associated protein